MPDAEAGRGAQIDAALDRSIGALLGLAVGDALGAPAEGRARDSYPPISEIGAAGGTDDTAMAVCLAESLLAEGGLDPRDLMRRFLGWYRAGGRGISTTTSAVLEGFGRTGRLDVADEAANAGNGCIMRLAPVAIRYRGDRVAARDVAAAQARLTHGAAEAIAATALLAETLVAALETGDLAAATTAGAGAAHPALARLAAGDYRSKARDRISSAPRALDTLEAALWCVARNVGFEAAVTEAVNLGGDADTIGAVAGQLAGALYGASAIPRRWLAGLPEEARLRELASLLHRAGDPI
jgi:ADP-ribosyl-[dinitrogen reductase] hydrolase